eukprot:CAMPEP_0194215722 /NCGR_PEP_ID=MMETSP0156-20130528/17734_1 /TAXON_ID=33649 /ORGANISM="Thalassionema nitzschioides, Strain L26-B" /LENGTH=548 /DNA_ID=CAMNT_0038944319 /DNA_START=46 /DNA_END=1689 /DNA_ORIENTATION=-
MRNQWRLAIFLYLIPLSSSLAAQASSSDGKSNSRLKPPDPSTERRSGGEGSKTTASTQNSSSVINFPKDLYTEAFIQRKSKRKNRRIRNPSAPVVDSTLLRFLSQQKVETKPLGYVEQELASASISQEGDKEQWTGQFMYENVKSTLIELGTPKAVAHEASMVVQSYVLARIKQRRIRYFLKKRDMEWENGGIANGLPENSSLGSPEYGLKDIIDILLEFKLTGHDIAAIFKHTPGIVLMMPRRYSQHLKDNMNRETLQDTLSRAYDNVLLGSLRLRRHDAKKILRSCPGLLTLRGSKRAEDVLTLMTSLGVSLKSLARTKATLPVLLSRSPSAMFRLISFLASDALRMPVKDIGPLLRGKSSLSLIDAVAPVHFILNADNLRSTSLNIEAERTLINEQYRKMSETVWTLRNKIGSQDLSKVIATYPSVLLLNAEEQILPVASYLMNDLGICKNDLPRVLQLYPFLLGKDVNSMQAIAEYLLNLGVKEEDLSGIFRAFPSLLTKDIETTMTPVVRFLQEIGIVNVGRFITRLPPVLGYSVEDDIKPKW